MRLLEHLSAEDYKKIEEYVQSETFAAGEEIIKQGEQGQRFYMIESGRVEVILEGAATVRLALLQSGEFFGEISCLTGEPITATIKAIDDVSVQTLSRQGLLELLDLHPAFMRKILDQLLQRMTKSNVRVQQESLKSSVFQSALSESALRYNDIVGASPAMTRLKEKVNRLAQTSDPVCLLGENGVGKKFIAGHIHYKSDRKQAPFLKESGLNFNRSQWRAKQSAAAGGSLLLTEADALPLDVLHTVLQEAVSETRIMMTAEQLPAIEGMERVVAPPLRERKEDLPALVKECLRREGIAELDRAVSGAAIRKLILYPFLDGNVQELFDVLHKAVILSDGGAIHPEHIQLGGNRPRNTKPRIGLALGSGAVRGCAHVGVLKVLEEEGISVDLIAGSSVGALVGSIYAAGKSIQYMEEMLPKVTWNQLTSWSWPKDGLLNNFKMERWMRDQIGDKQIEELSIPFSAVATDAETGMPVIMQSGSVGSVVRASTAIPLMMKPVRYQNKLLWDGSIVHKVPIHLARSMGADIVIGVDVGLPAFKKGKVKNLFDAFMFPLDIMQESMAQEEIELADVLLQPTVNASGYSFKSAPFFFKKGEEVTRNAIPQIRKAIEHVWEGFS